jgi:DNA polymerase III subunit beta
MDLRTDYTALADALRTVVSAVASRPTLPVLGGVRLDAADGRLRVTGTDLETTITTDVPAEVAADGAVLVPSGALRKLFAAKHPKGTTVTLTSDPDSGKLHITAAAGRGRVRLLDLDDFPAAPADGRPVADVPAATVQAWAAVVAAASDDQARPVLCSVLLEVGPEAQVTAAATDSYRLHVHTGQAAVHDQVALLVPADALATVVKAAKAAKAEQVTVGAGEADADGAVFTATFAIGATTFAVRLTEGEFPKYRSLIPDAAADGLVIRITDARLAVTALKAAPTAGGRGQAATPMVLAVAVGDPPTMTVSEQDVFTWEAELAGAVVEQAPCGKLAFHPGYLLDLLVAGQVDGEHALTLHGRDEAKPFVLRDGNGFTGLLMPVRLAS